jgi:hypothetical protein
MSTSRRSGPDHLSMPSSEPGAPASRQFTEGWQSGGQHGSGPPGAGGPGRKRRRRQRSQRNKPHRPAPARAALGDTVSRERVFQDLEGLLRQIREQAEESSNWAEDRLVEIAQTVTNFTKSLEEQVDPIPERARSEYQRIRDRLSQALKGE